MLSSAFFLSAASLIFYLRALAPFLQRSGRKTQKTKLLSALLLLKQMNFGEIATNAIRLTDRIFSTVGGSKILSASYVVRFAAIGLSLGILFSAFVLPFIAIDFAQSVRIVQKQYWWQFIFLPSVLTATLLATIDVACAHMLVRWGANGKTARAYIALIAALPMAYGLWAIGAGLAATFGILISSNLFIPSFVWNRIVIAFLNPIESSAYMQLGTRWLSYGLLAASSALSSLLVSVVFLVAALLKSFPARLQRTVAAPAFWALNALDWLERKQINCPIGVLVWSIWVVLLVCAADFHLLGI